MLSDAARYHGVHNLRDTLDLEFVLRGRKVTGKASVRREGRVPEKALVAYHFGSTFRREARLEMNGKGVRYSLGRPKSAFCNKKEGNIDCKRGNGDVKLGRGTRYRGLKLHTGV
jgi:hypothetical protein